MPGQKNTTKIPNALNQFAIIIEQHSDGKKSMDFYARAGLQFALHRLTDLQDTKGIEMMNRFIIMYEECCAIKSPASGS